MPKREKPSRTREKLEALWRPHPDFIGPVAPPMELWLRNREKQAVWRKNNGLAEAKSMAWSEFFGKAGGLSQVEVADNFRKT